MSIVRLAIVLALCLIGRGGAASEPVNLLNLAA